MEVERERESDEGDPLQSMMDHFCESIGGQFSVSRELLVDSLEPSSGNLGSVRNATLPLGSKAEPMSDSVGLGLGRSIRGASKGWVLLRLYCVFITKFVESNPIKYYIVIVPKEFFL